MSSKSKFHSALLSAVLISGLASLFFATPAAAQEVTPKCDVFGGYSFFYPAADLPARNPGASLPIVMRQESNPRGVGGSITCNLNRWFGLTFDGSKNWGSGEKSSDKVDDSGFMNVSFGPKFTLRRKHFA